MKNKRPVVVTTSHRGVFFGYITKNSDVTEKTLFLENARNCIYWRGIKGFLDLANTGPTEACRVGPAVNITITDITCVAECSQAAADAWEKAPW